MFSKVLVPLDGSPLAEKALPHATLIATRTGAQLLLMRAREDKGMPGIAGVDLPQEPVHPTDTYLSGIAAQLAQSGIAVETTVVRGDAPAPMSIVDEARNREADLIVMATHGRGGVSRWLYGSVASSVLAQTTTPVMLVRSRASDRPIIPQPGIHGCLCRLMAPSSPSGHCL